MRPEKLKVIDKKSLKNFNFKLSDSPEAVSRRQLEASLTRLNSLLGRPSDISKILLDSEESAEVFRLR